MPISHSNQNQLECDECGLKHSIDIWVIVDAEERPDVWELCREGSIHTFACPQGHKIYIGAPLLLHDPARQRVLFCPPLSPTTPEMERQMLDILMRWFHASFLATGARPSYVMRARRVSRDELPRVLSQEEEPAESPLGLPEDELLALFAKLETPRGPQDVPLGIQLCREALPQVDREKQAEAWARLQVHLGALLEHSREGNRAENLEHAIEARRAALTVYTREAFPREWASLQVNLGHLYSDRLQGTRDENAANAVEAYEAALTVFTRDKHPEDWKAVQRYLRAHRPELAPPAPVSEMRTAPRGAPAPVPLVEGRSVLDQIRDSFHEGDLARLVQLCRVMLQIVHPGNHVWQWAQLQILLGYGLLYGPERGQGEAAGEAARAFESAATVFTRDATPERWADLQWRIGVAHALDLQGDPEKSRQGSIRAFEAAYEEASRRESVRQWAISGFGGGHSYRRHRIASPEENRILAVRTFEAKRAEGPQEAQPDDWAQILLGLAEFWARPAPADRARNLERALQDFERVLGVFTREAYADRWAKVQLELGNVWMERLAGDRAENVELAIRAYESALTVYASEAYLQERARTLHNLGFAWQSRVRGDRGENLERAIQAYEAALQWRTYERGPVDWAATSVNLAIVLRDRVLGSPSFERARDLLEAALQVFTRERFPHEWAIVHYNLGGLYPRCTEGDVRENRELAVAAQEAALTVFTRGEHPEEWARAQAALGDAYRERWKGDRDDNRKRAVAAYEAALTVLNREEHPVEWANVQINLGNAYSSLAQEKDDPAHLRVAAAYRNALAVYDRERFPEDWAGIQNNLGNVHFAAGEFEEAIRCFEEALATGGYDEPVRTIENRRDLDRTRGWIMLQMNLGTAYKMRTLGERPDNLRQAASAYEAALRICTPEFSAHVARLLAANLGRVSSELGDGDRAYSAFVTALEAAEGAYDFALTDESKAAAIAEHERLYREMVELCLGLDPPRRKEAFLYAEAGRSRLLRDQLGSLPLPPPPSVPEGLATAEAELLERIRAARHALETESAAEARSGLLEEVTKAQARLDAIWDSMEQRYGAADYVALRRGERPGWEEVQSWLEAQGRPTALLEFFGVTDRTVAFIARAGEPEPRTVVLEISEQRLEAVQQRFSRAMNQDPPRTDWGGLAPRLLDGVMPHLEGIELLYIVPHGALHALPLHALEHEGRPLLESFPIVYAPSTAVAMRVARAQQPGTAGDGTLVVGNPTGDLESAEREAAQVARRFSVEPLLGGAATRERVRAALAGKTRVHFAAHASFDPGDPFASGILLAGDEVLSARDVMAHSLDHPLVVLSACQTGLHDVRPGDELAGLARAFLHAGARSMIVSQWLVDDEATEQLMIRFYNRLYNGEGIQQTSLAEALQGAILEARRSWPETFFWAPFLLFGSWR